MNLNSSENINPIPSVPVPTENLTQSPTQPGVMKKGQKIKKIKEAKEPGIDELSKERIQSKEKEQENISPFPAHRNIEIQQRDSALPFYEFIQTQEIKDDLDRIEKDDEEFTSLREELKGNRDFVFAALKRNGAVLKHVGDEFWQDYFTVEKALNQHPNLRGDYHFMLKAVGFHGGLLAMATPELQKEEDIVLAAVKQDPTVFEFVDTRFKGDISNVEEISETLRNNPKAIKQIRNTLFTSSPVVETVVKQSPEMIRFLDREIIHDKECVAYLIDVNPQVIPFLFPLIQNDFDLMSELEEFMRNLLENDGMLLQYLPEEIKNTREYVELALKNNVEAYQFSGDYEKENHPLLLELIEKDPKFYATFARSDVGKRVISHRPFLLNLVREIPEVYSLLDDRELQESEDFKDAVDTSADYEDLLVKIQANPDEILDVKRALKKDRNFVLAAVRQNGDVLFNVDPKFLKDEEVVRAFFDQNEGKADDRNLLLHLIEQNGDNLKFASENLKKDRDFVLGILEFKGRAFKHIDEDLKKDEELILTALQEDGTAIEFIPDDQKKELRFIRAAVAQNYKAFSLIGNVFDVYTKASYLDEEKLEARKNFIIEMIEIDFRVYELLNKELKNDPQLVLELLRRNHEIYKLLSNDVKNDPILAQELPQLFLDLVNENHSIFPTLDYDFRNLEAIALAAIRGNGELLANVGEDMKNNKNVVMAAVTQNGESLRYASESMKQDEEVITAAVQQNGEAIRFVDTDLRTHDLVGKAIDQTWKALRYINPQMQNDYWDLPAQAVAKNGRAYAYLIDELKNRPVFLNLAVKTYPPAYHLAGDIIKKNPEAISQLVIENPTMISFIDKSLLSPEARQYLANFIEKSLPLRDLDNSTIDLIKVAGPYLKKIHFEFIDNLSEETLIELLNACPNLESLTIKHCNLNGDFLEYIPRYLKSFNFSTINIPAEKLTYLPLTLEEFNLTLGSVHDIETIVMNLPKNLLKLKLDFVSSEFSKVRIPLKVKSEVYQTILQRLPENLAELSLPTCLLTKDLAEIVPRSLSKLRIDVFEDEAAVKSLPHNIQKLSIEYLPKKLTSALPDHLISLEVSYLDPKVMSQQDNFKVSWPRHLKEFIIVAGVANMEDLRSLPPDSMEVLSIRRNKFFTKEEQVEITNILPRLKEFR